jgi:hypothetical protein
LQGYKGVPFSFGGRQLVNVEFAFINLDVIESVEPYLFPIATITIRYSEPTDRGRPGQGSRWEVFSASMRQLMGAENADIDNIVGKEQEWAMLPGTLRLPLQDDDGNPVMMEDDEGEPVLDNQTGKPRQAWGDVEDACWKVVALEGVGSVEEVDTAFMAHLIELADGKDERGFYEAAFADPQVTAKPDVVQSITDRKLLQPLLDANRLTRDAEGILHKGEASA